MITFKTYALQSWSGDGQSALCLYDARYGRKLGCKYPYDPDDLCRCIQILRAMFGNDEEAKKKHILLTAEIHQSKVWKLIGENYDELMRVFKSEWDDVSAPKTYELMQRFIAEAQK